MPTKSPQVRGQRHVVEGLATTRREAAERAHAQYPQYAGHWDGWELAEVTRRVTTKGGLAFEPGDLVLRNPKTRTEQVPPRGRWTSIDEWVPKQFVTCYSFRREGDVSVPAEYLRPVLIED
jgi:hypothetical protein